MSNQEVMKMQTCVLRVNIHCHGCEHKVMKLLRRTEGVHATKVDAEQGMVTVTGNVDPELLIWKLEKSGKHAELWSAPKDDNNGKDSISQNQNFADQFKNIMQQKGGSGIKGDGKSQKGGGSGSGGNRKEDLSKLGGFGQNPQQQAVAAAFQAQLQQHMINMKGQNGKDPGVPPGYQKNFKVELPEDEPDTGSDEPDREELDDDVKSHGGAQNDGSAEKSKVVDEKQSGKQGSVFDIQGLMKALGKGERGGGGGDGKKRRKARKDGSSSSRSYGDSGGKEGEDGSGDKKNNKGMQQPDQMMISGKGADDGGGGGGMGRQMGPVVSYPIASYPPAQRLPAGTHVGDVMKMMNQQHQQQQLYDGHNNNNNNNGEMFHSATTTYAWSNAPPPMPPPASSEPFVHMFSDENANSCSVM